MSEDYQDIPEILGDLEAFLKKELPKKELATTQLGKKDFRKVPPQLIQIYKNHPDGGGNGLPPLARGVSWCMYDDHFEVIVCNSSIEFSANKYIGGSDPLSLLNRKKYLPEATHICELQFEVTQDEEVETVCCFQEQDVWVVSTMIPAGALPANFISQDHELSMASTRKRRGVSRNLGDEGLTKCVYHSYTRHQIPGAIYTESARYQPDVIAINISDKEHAKPKSAEKNESGFEVLKHKERYSNNNVFPLKNKK